MTAATDPHPADSATAPPMRVHRVEVRNRPQEPDPRAQSVMDEARRCLGTLGAAHTARVYLIEAALDRLALETIADDLLTDPVTQQAVIGAPPPPLGTVTFEVHYLPGVMDPVAQSTQDAIVDLLPGLNRQTLTVRTAYRYDLAPITPTPDWVDAARRFVQTALANPVINLIHDGPYHPDRFPHPTAYQPRVVHVPLRNLDDDGLQHLSRDGHLFLSLAEMRAIQNHYRDARREPTDIELETLAQTWSEHCVHKTLKATIHYEQDPSDSASPSPRDWADRPGHILQPDGTVTIYNLLGSTIAAATFKLMEEDPHIGDWCLSVFTDNAGVVRFDHEDAVCIKVETHNHPSAIEPYGGAATGIGGCIRDIMGTGLSARPIANTNVFCVAPPHTDPQQLPRGVIGPRRILHQVVAGVRDYGNRMGIPTVNGAVWFHDDYLGNPLVFAGCVGIMPADKCQGRPQPGDRIVAMGGRTGRDGIHGATFSSAGLTDTHADQFAHAVQIGNAITQKKVLDVILQARDQPGGALFHAITDCGAGGFSSAVGEMGKELGAHVTLDTPPLKYQGLTYTEIWISEAQERMVLAVPPHHLEALRHLCEAQDVECCDLGTFGTGEGEPTLILYHHQTEVGRIPMSFLHDGLPMPTRLARWSIPTATPRRDGPQPCATTPGPRGATRMIVQRLYTLLAHPNIASKHWIIRQYDHEVQGSSVVKPLVGPGQDGPSDAAVLRPKPASVRGVAIACGLQTGLGETAPGGGGDSYWMTLAAIDEAVRNCVCVGADPTRIAILDNFCWPNCDDPDQLGRLVRAAQACYDGALAYRTPFVSGKDSLNNQFTTDDGRLITIPPTLLITALGIVPDTTRCVTMDAKMPGASLFIVGRTDADLGGSHHQIASGGPSGDGTTAVPRVDLNWGPKTAAVVSDLIGRGLVNSAHDCSDGGLLVAAAEMAFAGRVGLDLDLQEVPSDVRLDDATACFCESPSRYLLEIAPQQAKEVLGTLRGSGVPFAVIGRFADHDRLTLRISPEDIVLDEPLSQLRATWLAPLDW